MKTSWIKKSDSEQLILFFGGFACDENLLRNFSFGNFDVLMFFDYSNLECDLPEEIFSYKKICTVGWSFGVWAADYFADRLPRSSMRIALCGSPFPVDNERGIPAAIFEGTLNGFDEEAKEKFLLRVFGAKEYNASYKMFAVRSATEEKQELANLGEAFKTFSGNPENWTRAIAAKSDKIFPLQNLERAWGGKLEVVSGEHFPAKLFEEGIVRMFTGAPLIAKAFGRSFESYEREANVQKKIAEHLAKLVLKRIDKNEIKNVLEIGVGTGFLTRPLVKKLRGKKWYLNDLSGDSMQYIENILDTPPVFIEGDAHIQDFPRGMDLIVSASCFQWMENLDAFFVKLAGLCHEGTILAFSTFLPENLREIRSLTGRGLRYMGIVGLESILVRAGFEILCSEAATLKVDFENPVAVLRHLRETGVGGAFAEFWTPQKLKAFSKQYADFFSTPKGVSLTYRPIYFVARYTGRGMAEE